MTRPCDDTVVVAGRLKKANQFLQSADDIGDIADDEAEARDAVVTLLVHAGIAATDVICCTTIGRYAVGAGNHNEAIDLLKTVRNPDGKELAKALRKLLGVKTKAAYTHRSVTVAERKRAQRAADDLVRAAREL